MKDDNWKDSAAAPATTPGPAPREASLVGSKAPKHRGMWKRKPIKPTRFKAKDDESSPPAGLEKPTAIAPGPKRKKPKKPNLGPMDPAAGWILPKGVTTVLPHSTNKEQQNMAGKCKSSGPKTFKEPPLISPNPNAAGMTFPKAAPGKTGLPREGGMPNPATKPPPNIKGGQPKGQK